MKQARLLVYIEKWLNSLTFVVLVNRLARTFLIKLIEFLVQ